MTVALLLQYSTVQYSAVVRNHRVLVVHDVSCYCEGTLLRQGWMRTIRWEVGFGPANTCVALLILVDRCGLGSMNRPLLT